jgi:hypothetical protein
LNVGFLVLHETWLDPTDDGSWIRKGRRISTASIEGYWSYEADGKTLTEVSIRGSERNLSVEEAEEQLDEMMVRAGVPVVRFFE